MSKSTTASASVVTLVGKTAVELRELLAQKQVTKKALVAFLREKETAHGLRAPAKKLLGELTGEETPAASKPEAKPAPAKTEPVKAAKPAPAKTEPVKAAKPAPAKDDLAALVKAIALLTAKVEALEAARAPATPAAKTNAAKARKTAAK